MLIERRRGPKPDPEQTMAGRCGTCGTRCECRRWQARPAQSEGPHMLTQPSGDPFGWSMTSMACTQCGATVYLSPAPERNK